MVTVIDAFMIGIGLDVSKLGQGQSEVERGAKQTAEAFTQTQQVTDKQIKEFNSALSDIRLKFAALAAVIEQTVQKFLNLATATAQVSMQTGQLAESLGVPVQKLSAFEQLAERQGDSLEQTRRALIGLKQAQLDFKATGQWAPQFSFLRALGISPLDAQGQLKPLDDLLMEIQKAINSPNVRDLPEAQWFARHLGFGQGMGELMRNLTPEQFRQQLAAMQPYVVTQQQVERGRALFAAWTQFSQSVGAFVREVISQITPALIKDLNKFTTIMGIINDPSLSTFEKLKQILPLTEGAGREEQRRRRGADQPPEAPGADSLVPDWVKKLFGGSPTSGVDEFGRPLPSTETAPTTPTTPAPAPAPAPTTPAPSSRSYDIPDIPPGMGNAVADRIKQGRVTLPPDVDAAIRAGRKPTQEQLDKIPDADLDKIGGALGKSIYHRTQAPMPANAPRLSENEALVGAHAVLAQGGDSQAVKNYLDSVGVNKDANWCGDFTAAYLRHRGIAPAIGDYSVASNWRKVGPEDPTPRAGDVAVRRNRLAKYGGRPVPTGAEGSHVGIVSGVRRGSFELLGGNQGAPVVEYPSSEYQFYRPPPPAPRPESRLLGPERYASLQPPQLPSRISPGVINNSPVYSPRVSHDQSQTHINTVNVTTSATDATGIAADIGKALQDHVASMTKPPALKIA